MILLRFDDLCPRMNWNNFVAIKEVLEEYNIKSILGVVPENHDPSLNVSSFNSAFYSNIRSYSYYGDSIAQHGTYHLYTSNSSGLLQINNNSEFAGHPYTFQFNLLKHGKELLEAKGIYPSLFMAPSHSFDTITLRALSNLGYSYVTDGYGWKPYSIYDMVLIPQLASKYLPLPLSFVQTICLHTNSMSEFQISCLIRFIRKKYSLFTSLGNVISSYNEACDHRFPRAFTRLALRLKRTF